MLLAKHRISLNTEPVHSLLQVSDWSAHQVPEQPRPQRFIRVVEEPGRQKATTSITQQMMLRRLEAKRRES